MNTVDIQVTDGRYFIAIPDAIAIRYGVAGDVMWVSADTWLDFTNTPLKPSARMVPLTITVELFKALKAAKLDNPPRTNNTIPSDAKPTTCPRCGGLGRIDAYKHIDGGICFECEGKGKINN